MDGIWLVTTSLEALIQRACNVTNTAPDQDAIDAICGLILKEPECCGTAVKLIVAKAHSLQEWEALQGLLVLENCMKRCGVRFHSEVGKFRFLNELIKLVSPKYLGGQTTSTVKSRVLELMAEWASLYPREPKIKEAYEMLKKQGVVQEEKVVEKVATSQSASVAGSQGGSKQRGLSVFEDDDQSQLLQRLLRSNKPADLQAANKLIKYMVKEDERRTEEKWRSATELETAVTQCSLLGDMVDRYAKEGGVAADVDLMAELHAGCLALRPALIRLASSQDPEFCCEVLAVNDELGEVLTKYRAIFGDPGRNSSNAPSSVPTSLPTPPVQQEPSLLDLSPGPVTAAYTVVETPAASLLEDIFGGTAQSTPPPVEEVSSDCLTNGGSINCQSGPPNSNNSKSKALKELDLLGESMLKEILNSTAQQNKPPPKVTMNDLMMARRKSSSSGVDDLNQGLHDLSVSPVETPPIPPIDTNVPKESSPLPTPSSTEVPAVSVTPETASSAPTVPPPGSPAVSLADEPLLGDTPAVTPARCTIITQPAPLSDISLTISDVKPSSVTPYKESVGELSLTITLAKDRPREDVSVHVITTTSTHASPVEQFLFQPVVPKCCRLRLLPPSSTGLPPHNPFLPPAAITQIMLIASATRDPIKMKYVISYIMEEETITEMCEIAHLPLSE